MAKPKFEYKVVVERIVKQEYVVTAKNERDALRQIKRNAKDGLAPTEVAVLGTDVSYGKLVRPATWPITQVSETQEIEPVSAE